MAVSLVKRHRVTHHVELRHPVRHADLIADERACGNYSRSPLIRYTVINGVKI